MKVTWNWLAELVEMELPPARLAERLTLAGFEVESVEERGRELAEVRCAQVEQVRPHPHADRLTVCEVRGGGDAIATVVCGAPNVRAGERVAYAPAGVTLPGGQRIEAADIRGITSAGMLCSAAELGLGSDAAGILLLPGDATIGERLSVVLGIEDIVLDIAVTPNRGDCLSVLGLAREIAALTGQRLRRRRIVVPETGAPTAERISIQIADAALCGRYVARVIADVTVAPSPWWMQSRLRAVGLRPINNVVDITNYVMIECGQPLHAFDYDRLPRQQIVVRRAGRADRFATLDGEPRQVEPDDLLITTGEHPIAIAGVMGGAETEVTADTRTILLESAWFAPASVRRTARRLGLQSEASYRFERCTDIDGVVAAADRAAALLVRLAGGVVGRGRVDVYPAVQPPAPIALRLKRIEELLGMSLARAEVVGQLKALGLQVSLAMRGTLTVVPPSYRSDLMREIDLVEEIVRLVGYENVPTTLPDCALAGAGEEAGRRRQRDLRAFLVALGLTEVVPATFCPPRLNALFPELGGPRAPVTVVNPLAQDEAELRQSLCASLVRVVRTNVDQGATSLAVFCLGKVFWRERGCREALRLAGAVWRAFPARGLGSHTVGAEFADVKGLVEAVFDGFGIEGARWSPAAALPAFHPGKTARIELDGAGLGLLGLLHPTAEEALELPGPCWLFELDLDKLLQYGRAPVLFGELPRFPVVVRDIAVVTEDNFASDGVIRFVREWQTDHQWIEDIHVFDEYIGPPIPAGKKSLAYSISYRAPDRTLTDAEVNEMHARLTAALKDAFGLESR